MAEGLIFLMRVRQAEETIEKRRDDLLKRQKTAASLEVELEHEKGLTDAATQDLARLREQAEALVHHRVQLHKDTAAARQDLTAAQSTARLLAQKASLQRQLDCLRAAAANERRVQQQYEAVVSRHLEDSGRKAQELKDRAEQIRTKQQQLEQQESKLWLPEVTSKLQQQHDQLQAKLQQLTATLTDSKQDNACMRARVDAAIADTKTQLQASTERLADVKREAFQLKRQATVNDTRLQQLRQESSRSKQQCGELEALILRASAVMDQLASNCDL